MQQPDKTQQGVLQQLADKIEEIVDAAGRDELAATGVLDEGLGFTPADYDVFHRRFALLRGRLQELMDAKRVFVNAKLPHSAGALAVSAKDEENVNIQLQPETVDPNAASSITDRACTLIHEISHTLREGGEHPVKDYTYRGTWAQGYLAGEIGARNADTYYEAAARIAEKLEAKPAGFYGERGSVPARRRVLWLRQAESTLGPALAWADIKLNRVWLRAFDLRARLDADLGVTAVFEALRSDADLRALETIEAGLKKWAVIGSRARLGTGRYDDGSVAAAGSIEAWAADLKDRLKAVHLLFPANGPVTYDATTETLAVPLTAMGIEPVELAEVIIGSLVVAATFPASVPAADPSAPPPPAVPDPVLAALGKYKTEILDLLWNNDRSYEKPQVDKLAGSFAALKASGVGPNAAESFSTAMALAEAGGEADRWAVAPGQLLRMPKSVLDDADVFDEWAAKGIERAATIALDQARRPFLDGQAQLVAKLRVMIAALEEAKNLTAANNPTARRRGAALITTLTTATDKLAAADPNAHS